MGIFHYTLGSLCEVVELKKVILQIVRRKKFRFEFGFHFVASLNFPFSFLNTLRDNI